MRKKFSIVQILRAISQLAFLYLLPALVGLAFGEIKSLYMSIADGTFRFTDFAGRFAVLIALLPLTILLGRFFCGWICSFGALNDFVYAASRKVFKTKWKVSARLDRILKYAKYAVLAFIIVVLWTMGSAAFDQISPWGAFAGIPDLPGTFFDNPIGFLVLAFVVTGAFIIERFFCRYICPLGAVLALSSVPRLFRISKPGEKCGKCRICTNQCAMGIELYTADKVTSVECINCFKCTDACPRNNAQASMIGEDVNPKAAGAAVIAAFTGIYTAVHAVETKDYAAPAASYVERPAPSIEPGTGPSNERSTGPSTAPGIASGSSPSLSPSSAPAASSTPSAAPSASPRPVQGAPTSSTSPKAAATNGKYKDGTYTGTARGYRPGLTVSVTVLNGQISQVKIVSHNESRGFYERPFSTVPQAIISKQSTIVDTVSGATRSSEGVMNAVANALANARA